MNRVQFSADGIRDIVGAWPITPSGAWAIGCAVGKLALRISRNPHIIIGRDTRPSGGRLAHAFSKGVTSQGVNIIDVGVVSTPGLAHVVRKLRAQYGVIISASHNPTEYNGFKFLDSRGLRISRNQEVILGKWIQKKKHFHNATRAPQYYEPHLVDFYIQDQVELGLRVRSLKGFTVVLDCANGALSRIAPEVFKRLGAQVSVINDESGGRKINYECGSEFVRQNPHQLLQSMHEHRANYGFAFDGDGDRLVTIDSDGRIYDGNDLLFVIASFFHAQGQLRGNTIVTTKMYNSGLRDALKKQGIRTVFTTNGDKHLEARIWRQNYLLGAEQVGNVIVNDGDHSAADSLYAAVLLSQIILFRNVPLNKIVAPLIKRPQILCHTRLKNPLSKKQILGLKATIKHALGKSARALIWNSSTEVGRLNVMIEGDYSHNVEQVSHKAFEVCQKVGVLTDSQLMTPIALRLSSRKI